MTSTGWRLASAARCLAIAVAVVSCTACLTLTEEPFAEKLQDDRIAGVWVKESTTWDEGPAVLSIARSEPGYIGWHGREAVPQEPLVSLHLSSLSNGLWAQVEVPGEHCQKFMPFGPPSRCYLTAKVSGLPNRLVLSQPRPGYWVRRSLEGDIGADHALVGAGGKGSTLWSFYLASPMAAVARVLGDAMLPAEAFEPLVEYARER